MALVFRIGHRGSDALARTFTTGRNGHIPKAIGVVEPHGIGAYVSVRLRLFPLLTRVLSMVQVSIKIFNMW